TVHHVRRRRGGGTGLSARLRCFRRQGRRGRVTLGCRTRPASEPSARGDRRCSGLAEHGVVALVLRAAAVTEPGCVAGTPSSTLVRGSVSERPKEHASKACEGKPSVGSNPTATADGLFRSPRCKGPEQPFLVVRDREPHVCGSNALSSRSRPCQRSVENSSATTCRPRRSRR